MTAPSASGFVAECFWTGAKESDLVALDRRVEDCVGGMARDGQHVRYLGSMLMPEDEVVMCFFEGSAASVRRAAELAEIPFERILETTHSGAATKPKNTIIVVCFPGRVEALDAGTGGALWTNTNIASPVGFPSIYGAGSGGRILITSGTQVVELRAATGSVVWHHDTGSTIGSGLALVGTFGIPGGTPVEVVVDTDTGGVLALDPVVGAAKWSSATAAPTRSSPVAANGVVYMTADPSPGAGGQVLALDATTGAILFRGDDGTPPAGTTQSPSVIVVDAHIFAGGYDGGLRFFGLP